MTSRQELIEALEKVGPDNFDSIALELFSYQYESNPVYQAYVDLLRKQGRSTFIRSIEDIPFLPISFFKSRTIKTGSWEADTIYTSSTTTGSIPSQHYVRNNALYLRLALKHFEQFYGSIQEYVFLALLPGYLERQGSSLVSMADYFIQQSNHSLSGFYLHDLEALLKTIEQAKSQSRKIILLGVSFALWTLAEKGVDLKDVIVMETGGMKGRGPELPKAAFHDFLKAQLNIEQVHSEYGMTELLSQAYSTGNTIFKAAPTMRILTREVTDPFNYTPLGKAGVINIIDLANIDSCAFIATDDLGIRLDKQEFQVLGRLDNAEIRGCNLLVSDM